MDAKIERRLRSLDCSGYVSNVVLDAIKSGDVEKLNAASYRTQELVDLIDELILEAESKEGV